MTRTPTPKPPRQLTTTEYAEILHADRHPGTHPPTLDTCPTHTRAHYEQLAELVLSDIEQPH